jgi:hypothetical protein
MKISRQEEIIAALWIIAAILCFGFNHEVWGWIFAIKGGMDTLSSIWCAFKEVWWPSCEKQ